MPILNDTAIKNIAVGGNIIYKIFQMIERLDLSGMETIELNDKIDQMIRDHNALPAFLNYRGFPKSVCISLNDEVVHGIPDDREIQNGDLIKIDIGVKYQGYFTDAAKTFSAGKITPAAEKLVMATKAALKMGIKMARKGNKISDISRAIQHTVEKNNFNVVRELTGHGVGLDLHEEPMIPNFVLNGPDHDIKPGMVLAIEPMVNMGGADVVTAKNGWTILTKDHSLSCHFEDTIVILENGNLNITRIIER